MAFSDESTQKLAEAIAQQVFEYISEDDRYLDGIMNTIGDAIHTEIGETSPELVGELGCAIMGMIGVRDHNIWKTRYETLYRHIKENYAESYVDGAEYGMMDTRFEEN